jgi:hypothetical protein
MKIPAAIFGLVLEATFLVYCIYMICLLDILDPFPREWMIPNIVIGALILAFGYFFASGSRISIFSEDRWSERNRHTSDFPRK